MTSTLDDARGELLALADEFEGEAKAHRAMGDKAEARKCDLAAQALRAAPVPQCGAGIVDAAKAVSWERLAWDWQKRAFEAEAKLAALVSPPSEAGREANIARAKDALFNLARMHGYRLNEVELSEAVRAVARALSPDQGRVAVASADRGTP